jgi:glutathione S-transferase
MISSTLPILYSFRRCPYAMRARLALYAAKIPHEHREIHLKDKPLEMLAISPKGTVPVLQLEEGTVLEESLDIMSWAFHMPPLSLEDQQIITENDTSFKHTLDRYKYPGRYGEESGISYRNQCETFLSKLENRLNPFLAETTISLVDMAIFPFIRQFAMVDSEWFETQPYPCLKIWLDSFISTPLFQQVMQDYPVWSPGNQPIVIAFEA